MLLTAQDKNSANERHIQMPQFHIIVHAVCAHTGTKYFNFVVNFS